ncbi:MAG: hypothetical protein P4L59_13375 [Desulfosporosinus sp.]|nr:hypothetical protein [Desulfosporosinus sp.]
MDTKDRVEWLLKNYHEIKMTLEIMKLQIDNFSGLSYAGTIEGLTFAASTGEYVQNSNISDKSGKIALIYRDIVATQNEEVLRGMTEEYYVLNHRLDTLEYAISLLDERLSGVITDMFINKMTWDDMCDKYYVSRPMLSKYRKTGIEQITKIFEVKHAV